MLAQVSVQLNFYLAGRSVPKLPICNSTVQIIQMFAILREKGKANFILITTGERKNLTQVEDKVLVRQDRENKFSTKFNSTSYTVEDKVGNALSIIP